MANRNPKPNNISDGHRISLRIQPALEQRIIWNAQHQQTSVSEYVRQILEQYTPKRQ